MLNPVQYEGQLYPALGSPDGMQGHLSTGIPSIKSYEGHKHPVGE
jgi:hypothetical protein